MKVTFCSFFTFVRLDMFLFIFVFVNAPLGFLEVTAVA